MKRNPRLEKIRKRIPEHVKATIDHSFNIVDRIDSILASQNRTRRDLAVALAKSESEISKWMRGTHNFTIKSIAKLELALGQPIIQVPRSTMAVYTFNCQPGLTRIKSYSIKRGTIKDNLIFTAQTDLPLSTSEPITQFN
jgi:transcriptional regulator with XRE-family HTH domain